METSKQMKVAIASSIIIGVLTVGGTAFADTNTQQQGRGNGAWGRGGMMRHMPGVFGTVDSISGSTLTVTSKAPPKRDDDTNAPAFTSQTYTVDASNAKIMKEREESSLSAIAVGDTVMIEGTVNGTSITANVIHDGVPPRGERPEGAPSQERQMGAMVQGNGQPVVGGSISSINGSTFTITNKSNASFTIDASAATVIKEHATSTVSNLAVGDNVVVQGAVNGSSVSAASVTANTPQQNQSNGTSDANPGRGRGFMGMIGGFFRNLFGFF